MTPDMHAWILSLLIAVSPPGRVPSRESYDDAIVRYESIATDLEAVVTDAAPLYSGPHGHAQTAALLVAIAAHESGLRRDVDEGETRGGGKDACLLQLRNRPDAATDRRTCFRVGLRLVRASLAACRTMPERERLAAYASGSCERGRPESRAMLDAAKRLYWSHPAPLFP